MADIDSIYHEKQIRALCAVHALNNLFQNQHAFTKSDLDELCMTLTPSSTWINPHRSMLGIGDYDVNVVMAALQSHNCDAIWFDKRKNIHELNIYIARGFILNFPSNVRFGPVKLPVRRKHWIAITNVAGCYYNLDSKLEQPERIGDGDDLKNYLKKQLNCPETELLVVVEQSVKQEDIWITSNDVT